MKLPEKLEKHLNEIILKIENNEIKIEDLWANSSPKNPATNKYYRGANNFLCNIACAYGGYKTNNWLTFKQIKNNNGTIKKGSKSIPIMFFNFIEIKETDEEGNKKKIPLVKYYNVFNVEDVEGLPEKYYNVNLQKNFDSDIEVEKIISELKANIKYSGSNRAFYSPDKDTVYLPFKDSFKSKESFYSVLFHELSHWTGHESRLNRKKNNKFGSKEYAIEELIAELSSGFVCSSLGIEKSSSLEAGYLKSWLSKFDNPIQTLIKISSQAQKACDFILNNK